MLEDGEQTRGVKEDLVDKNENEQGCTGPSRHKEGWSYDLRVAGGHRCFYGTAELLLTTSEDHEILTHPSLIILFPPFPQSV